MNGLTDAEVEESKKLYGTNKINVKDENKFISLFLRSLGDPIIKIMLIAVSLRFIFMFSSKDWYETLGMIISILMSSLISSLSEYGSNKAFKKLQSEYEKVMVLVKRNGKQIKINSEDVVVGDIVYIRAGEKVCADGIIIDGYISVDESSINGESLEVNKTKNDIILKGSIVTLDECVFKVLRVGENTIYGNIAKELSEKNPDSPMKIRLTHLAKIISRIGIIGAILVAISYLFNVIVISNHYNYDLIINTILNKKLMIDTIIHALTLSLTIIIVCVPEGLPMMIALVLSSNMKRMLKNNVLVRRPVGIETSGSLSVLLVDKTGTLTTGNLTCLGLVDHDDNHYNKSEISDEVINAINYNIEAKYNNNEIIGGNGTDQALLKFIGYHVKNERIASYVHFNSNIKYSSVTLESGVTYYKGAEEVLLKKCVYYLDKNNNKKFIKNNLKNIANKYTKKGMRVITLIKDNIFLGFLILQDEIRSDAYNSIQNIESSGIHIIMASGDALLTCTEIANKLNLIDDKSIVIDHDTLVKMSDEEIIKNYKRIRVIARALPTDKSRVSTLLEKSGLVVGMTGDGINDAPALKKSSVGFSLGSGTEIAKEASDIVILDDKITSLENAILYGRTIFKSIRKFIVFQLTMNFCALMLSIIGPFLGITTPVTIMQMLWINMIMDTFAGIAFSYCPPNKEYMKERPIKKNEPILNKYMYITIIVNSLYESILLILFLKLPIISKFIRIETNYYLTSFFSLFVFINIFNAFNARTTRINIFNNMNKNKIFVIIFTLIFIAQFFIIYNGGALFRTYGLTINELIFILILSISIIPIDIIKKILLKNK